MTKKITHLSRAPLFLRFLRLAFRIKLAALGDRCLNCTAINTGVRRGIYDVHTHAHVLIGLAETREIVLHVEWDRVDTAFRQVSDV